jgi:sec-independent protein translocase protein TatA
MPFHLGFGELLVILAVALLIFGKRLPEVGRSLGRGIVEFKRGLNETDVEEHKDADLPKK